VIVGQHFHHRMVDSETISTDISLVRFWMSTTASGAAAMTIGMGSLLLLYHLAYSQY
jgi:hypothetical protein